MRVRGGGDEDDGDARLPQNKAENMAKLYVYAILVIYQLLSLLFLTNTNTSTPHHHYSNQAKMQADLDRANTNIKEKTIAREKLEKTVKREKDEKSAKGGNTIYAIEKGLESENPTPM